MEQTTQKKAWVTPELTVLVRSKPEEAVLVTCKTGGVAGGPVADWCWSGVGLAGCDIDRPS